MLPHAPSCRPSDTWSSCHGARRALHRIFLGWAHAVPAWMDPHECPLRSCTLTKLSDASSPHVAGSGSFGLQPVHAHDRAKILMPTAGTAGDVSFCPVQIADPRCAPRGRRRVAGESSPPIKISRAPLQCPDPFRRPAQQTKLWSVPHACCPRAMHPCIQPPRASRPRAAPCDPSTLVSTCSAPRCSRPVCARRRVFRVTSWDARDGLGRFRDVRLTLVSCCAAQDLNGLLASGR